MAASTDPGFDETKWYRRDESLLVSFAETIKTPFYRIAYRGGAVSPGGPSASRARARAP